MPSEWVAWTVQSAGQQAYPSACYQGCKLSQQCLPKPLTETKVINPNLTCVVSVLFAKTLILSPFKACVHRSQPLGSTLLCLGDTEDYLHSLAPWPSHPTAPRPPTKWPKALGYVLAFISGHSGPSRWVGGAGRGGNSHVHASMHAMWVCPCFAK